MYRYTISAHMHTIQYNTHTHTHTHTRARARKVPETDSMILCRCKTAEKVALLTLPSPD